MYNAHGDVTALINTTGAVVATYDYDAFGTITEKTGTVNNSITYAGYQYDAESDMYYLNARYYDSKIARFMTEDTYRGQSNDPLSLNLYSYVSNNPVRYYDPTGHTLLTVGSSGTEVAKMQGMLIQAGYSLGSSGADGKFGNKTQAAIKDFQKKTGCTVDGKVGNQTMTVLAAAVKAPLSAGVDLKNVAANAKTGGLTTSVVAPNKGQTNQTQEVKKINTTPTPPKVPILPKPAAVVKETTTVVPTQIKQAPTASKGTSQVSYEEARNIYVNLVNGTPYMFDPDEVAIAYDNFINAAKKEGVTASSILPDVFTAEGSGGQGLFGIVLKTMILDINLGVYKDSVRMKIENGEIKSGSGAFYGINASLFDGEVTRGLSQDAFRDFKYSVPINQFSGGPQHKWVGIFGDPNSEVDTVLGIDFKRHDTPIDSTTSVSSGKDGGSVTLIGAGAYLVSIGGRFEVKYNHNKMLEYSALLADEILNRK